MNHDSQMTELEAAVAEARSEERRRWMRWTLFAATVALVITLGAGILIARVQAAAPVVVGEIAAERRASIEARFDARAAEAARLASDAFGFLELVWRKNEAIEAIRDELGGARNQAEILQREVLAAIDDPVGNLRALYDNGPTRARAVFDHLVASVKILRQFLPSLVTALATASAELADGEEIELAQAALDAFVIATEPLVGEDGELRRARDDLVERFSRWREAVTADLAFAREQMSPESLNEAFERRLLRHVF